jgi:uncharacterized membrane protein YhdT
MDETRIILSGIWAALILTYLLGDMFRLYSGDFKPGEGFGGKPVSQGLWFALAIFMLIPIVMIVLSLVLVQPVNRWVNIGLPTYKSAYDKFLIVVGLGFNILTGYYAWMWVI